MDIRPLTLVAALQLLALCVPCDAHADRLMGAVYIEPSGDSPYWPFSWCGDKLWVESETTVALFDPLTEEPVWQVSTDAGKSDQRPGRLFACSRSTEQTVLWLDSDITGDELSWRLLSGAATGRLQHILRSDYGYPLLSLRGALAIGIGSKERAPQADKLPRGLRLRYIDADDVRRHLDGDFDLRSVKILSNSLMELSVWSYRRIKHEIVLLKVEENPADPRMTVIGSLELSRVLSGDPSGIVDVSLADAAAVATILVTTNDGEKKCRIEKPFEKDARAYCAQLDAHQAKAVENRLPENPGIYDVSPDGKWIVRVVPAEAGDTEEGIYHVYLTPSSELSPP